MCCQCKRRGWGLNPLNKRGEFIAAHDFTLRFKQYLSGDEIRM